MNAPSMNMIQALSNFSSKQAHSSSPHSDSMHFARLFVERLNIRQPQGVVQLKQALRSQVKGGDPLLFSDTLKKSLLAAGFDANQIHLGKKGVEAYQKLLLDLGVDPQQVNHLVGDLKHRAAFKEISLADLLGSLQSLEAEDPQAEVSLDASAVPFIESILTELRLPTDQVAYVLDKTVSKSQNIQLSRLLQALRQVQQKVAANQMQPGDEKGRQQVLEMMNRIGIPVDPQSSEPVGLGDLIHRIERMLAVDGKPVADQQTLIKDLSLFIDHLKPAAGQNARNMKIRVDSKGGFPNSSALHPGATGADSQDLSLLGDNKPGNQAMLAFKSEYLFRQLKSTGEEGRSDPGEIQDFTKAAGLEKSLNKLTGGDVPVGNPARLETAAVNSSSPVSAARLPSYVLSQVGTQLVKARFNNENEVRLQLKPPHLGRIFMTIENQLDGLKVSVVTEQQAAREMLQSHMHELRSLLNEQGLRIDKLDVELSQNFDQTMADARQGRQRQKGFRPEGGERRGEGDQLTAAQAALSRTSMDGGVLHLLA